MPEDAKEADRPRRSRETLQVRRRQLRSARGGQGSHAATPVRSIGAIAAALAKAQAETHQSGEIAGGNCAIERSARGRRSFRYAPLSSGLDIVRKALGHHEIATVQSTAIDNERRTYSADHRARPFIRENGCRRIGRCAQSAKLQRRVGREQRSPTPDAMPCSH